MTEAQLDEIARKLGITLPEAYRDFAVAWGRRPGPLRPYGAFWFWDDATWVIRATQFRRDEVAGWPPAFLVIGEGAAGDLHVPDAASPHAPVLCVSHETDELEPE